MQELEVDKHNLDISSISRIFFQIRDTASTPAVLHKLQFLNYLKQNNINQKSERYFEDFQENFNSVLKILEKQWPKLTYEQQFRALFFLSQLKVSIKQADQFFLDEVLNFNYFPEQELGGLPLSKFKEEIIDKVETREQ